MPPWPSTALLLTGCSSGSSDAITDVDVAEAQQIVEDGDAVILDVRTPEEFAAGHLPGAINIDVESSDFADRVAGLDESTETLVYCRTGNRSGVATDEMADLGFTDHVRPPRRYRGVGRRGRRGRPVALLPRG